MSVVQPEIIGKADDRLAYLLEQVKEGILVFTKAVRESSDIQVAVSFKAFTLKTERKEEALAIFDVIMSAVAIDLKKEAEDLIAKYTFFHSIDHNDEIKEHCLSLHCRKVVPPTKEEVDALVKAEEEAKSEVAVLEG